MRIKVNAGANGFGETASGVVETLDFVDPPLKAVGRN